MKMKSEKKEKMLGWTGSPIWSWETTAAVQCCVLRVSTLEFAEFYFLIHNLIAAEANLLAGFSSLFLYT